MTRRILPSISATAIALPLLLLTSACVGLNSSANYPDRDGDRLGRALLSPRNEEDPSVALNNMRVRPEACEGIDTHPPSGPLAGEDLAKFLAEHGVAVDVKKARGDLYWYEFLGENSKEGDRIRLRLAVLDSSDAAADELHRSLLEHGPGWWGLRRGNLSVLAPRGGLGDTLDFAIVNKLICWGMYNTAGIDDVYVVAGPYMEL